jgi:hypothetical protein
MTDISDPLTDADARIRSALWAAWHALDNIAEAAAHTVGQVRIGPDGEGQDFADDLEAIRDEASAASAAINALMYPGEAA